MSEASTTWDPHHHLGALLTCQYQSVPWENRGRELEKTASASLKIERQTKQQTVGTRACKKKRGSAADHRSDPCICLPAAVGTREAKLADPHLVELRPIHVFAPQHSQHCFLEPGCYAVATHAQDRRRQQPVLTCTSADQQTSHCWKSSYDTEAAQCIMQWKCRGLTAGLNLSLMGGPNPNFPPTNDQLMCRPGPPPKRSAPSAAPRFLLSLGARGPAEAVTASCLAWNRQERVWPGLP